MERKRLAGVARRERGAERRRRQGACLIIVKIEISGKQEGIQIIVEVVNVAGGK